MDHMSITGDRKAFSVSQCGAIPETQACVRDILPIERLHDCIQDLPVRLSWRSNLLNFSEIHTLAPVAVLHTDRGKKVLYLGQLRLPRDQGLRLWHPESATAGCICRVPQACCVYACK